MPTQSIYTVLIHYSEIALKKNNRSFFENIFIQNIKIHLQKLKYKKIYLKAARIFVYDIDKNEWEEFKQCLKNVMGLKNVTLMLECDTNIDSLMKASKKIISNKNFESYRISTKRHDKSLNFNSQDVNIKIGDHIKTLTNKPVNLGSPDLNIIIELLKNKSYIGIDKIIGYSGLPANCQEKALSLISSGIDFGSLYNS